MLKMLADELGIKYITVYAFSTENWKRPEEEVSALMKLLRNYLKDCVKKANKNNITITAECSYAKKILNNKK
mgnify:CR=1 FL=1